MRIVRISSRPEREDGEPFAVSNLSSSNTLSWNPARFERDEAWAQERAVLSNARSSDGLLISGMSLGELESLFNVRALQLFVDEGRLEVPAIVFVRSDGGRAGLPRLGDRMRSGWPFCAALFIADGPTVDFLRNEGLLAIDAGEARHLNLRQLFDRAEDGVFPIAPAGQSISVQIQPMWLRSGSMTPFANQIEALLDRNLFVLRIFIDNDARPGPTLRRRLEKLLPEATVDAAPHIEAFAGPAGHASGDVERADEAYLALVRRHMSATIGDEIIAGLAARAGVAMVNYAINIPFALGACPAARIVLETHDYMTRQTLERARFSEDAQAFPSCGSIRRHLELEYRLWRAADLCVSLSRSELAKMQRHCEASVYVVPTPYARRSVGSAANATWDILIVANPHQLNVQSIDWFLEQVISRDPRLARLRIAIVGRVREEMEPRWRDKLRNVQWLGYVGDIEGLRDVSRLSVCPDLAGTGVSIKVLTAMAAEHPIVATRAALRGLGDKISDIIPAADSADEMQAQILGLLDDELLERRRELVSTAFKELRREMGHERALSFPSVGIEDRSLARVALLKSLEVDAKPIDQPIRPNDDPIVLRFGVGGNETGVLGRGWQENEDGGRWTDGAVASLLLPAAWINPRPYLEVSFVQDHRGFTLDLRYGGKSVPPVSSGVNEILFHLDLSKDRSSDEYSELEIVASSTFCPEDEGLSDDPRVLGVFVKSLKLFSHPPDDRKTFRNGGLSLRKRIASLLR